MLQNLNNIFNVFILGCIERCIESTLSNYNPVCGSDNQTYHNQERFDCANECGASKLPDTLSFHNIS